MNLTQKIIITDTNIITDLNNAKVLDKFVNLNNVYISDMILNDEINNKTGNISIIKSFKVISSSAEELIEMHNLSLQEKKLSAYDLINYVLAKNHNYILATGDNRLKNYAESNGVEVIRTLMIIKLMREKNIISVTDAINACQLLLENENTRIPKESLIALMQELSNVLVNI